MRQKWGAVEETQSLASRKQKVNAPEVNSCPLAEHLRKRGPSLALVGNAPSALPEQKTLLQGLKACLGIRDTATVDRRRSGADAPSMTRRASKGSVRAGTESKNEAEKRELLS